MKLNILSQIFTREKYFFQYIYIVKIININENLYIYANQAQHSVKYYYLIFMILLNLFDMSNKRCSYHCIRDAFKLSIVECHAISLG